MDNLFNISLKFTKNNKVYFWVESVLEISLYKQKFN